jgi:hypothetical protein
LADEVGNTTGFAVNTGTKILRGILIDPGFDDLISGFVGLKLNLEYENTRPATMKMEPVRFKENKPTVIHALGYKPSLDFLEFCYFEHSP